MPAQTTHTETVNLLLLEDLDDAIKTSDLPKSDLTALRTVADWITSFVVKPHEDLGRAGPVCPFVPMALERKTLWLVPEHMSDRSTDEVVDLISGYQRLFLDTQPTEGDDAILKSFFIVFADLRPDRAREFFDNVLQHLAVPSYKKDGFAMGGFYEGNEATAIYNASFRPFTSPVPSLLMRLAVISDWKFFLDNDEWLNLWAHRYGESGVKALAEELRRLPWRSDRTAAS